MENNYRNIGVLAHVDAGKTTITENILFISGSTRKLGNVDQGTAITDNMEMEKQRGISIKAAPVALQWKGNAINLIDTPGHADFISEVERSLQIVNGAILVVSAVEGVQSNTYLLWQALKAAKMPAIIVINKVDRAGSDYRRVIEQLVSELKISPVPLNTVEDEGLSNASLMDCWNPLSSNYSPLQITALEALANNDDLFMEDYFEGKNFSKAEVFAQIQKQTTKAQIVPVMASVAKKNLGTEELLDFICELLPVSTPVLENSDLSAMVFKVEHHPVAGRLAHVRVFNGQVASRLVVENYSQQKEMKVASIKKKFTNKYIDVSTIDCGDIGILTGMPDVRPGDILGNPEGIPVRQILQAPVLTIQIHPENMADYGRLGEALEIMDAEDPNLNFQWFKDDREMHLTLTGTIRMEILGAELEERYDISTTFDEPTVIYKETPSSIAEGYVEYTMPKPCWAVMTFRVEPAERGSGIAYKSIMGVNKIHRKYQNEIERTVPKALEQGIQGWAVTDLNITLVGGEDHEIHSRPGDFILATSMGIMRALQNAGTSLLEPIYKFYIVAPEEHLGAIASDITAMRGTINTPSFEEDIVKVSGLVPVATSHQYGIRLSSVTKGKGILRFEFAGYQACPDGEGQSRAYKGVSPLDESKWILHHRGAYKADDRKIY